MIHRNSIRAVMLASAMVLSLCSAAQATIYDIGETFQPLMNSASVLHGFVADAGDQILLKDSATGVFCRSRIPTGCRCCSSMMGLRSGMGTT